MPVQAQPPKPPSQDSSQPVSQDLPFTLLQDLSSLEDGSLKQHVRSLQGPLCADYTALLEEAVEMTKLKGKRKKTPDHQSSQEERNTLRATKQGQHFTSVALAVHTAATAHLAIWRVKWLRIIVSFIQSINASLVDVLLVIKHYSEDASSNTTIYVARQGVPLLMIGEGILLKVLEVVYGMVMAEMEEEVGRRMISSLNRN